ncbi:hypothetical protein BDW02DRAFT_640868 [Decorospora gaudefroyi]|uniref:Indoleamine 2,3-dioxygenase n=1 Tax=Decorospora gaudefroyi TaxID=184978 RepID=A0A6A5K8F5_9PLEO|nr:hypothetical protein BDW02DRAFT_640868 [Decorospora gaudefroyi]
MHLLILFAFGSVLLGAQMLLRPVSRYHKPSLKAWLRDCRVTKIKEIRALARRHVVAEILDDMIQKDGAGSWPPNANHEHSTWPVPLRPFKEIYLELAALLPQATPSLDDKVNTARIEAFRRRFRDSLRERVNLAEVIPLLQAADAGRWVVFPRDVYNAFYCCIAVSRHAFRWATIPVVSVAQLEKTVEFPIELVKPWASMQRHFGCTSDSGNLTSNVVLNFHTNGEYIHRINTGMTQRIMSGEESFSRIFYDIEMLSLPVYHDMVSAIATFAHGDAVACARHVASITSQLRLILGSYMNNMHDNMIPHSVWLSYVQGFQAWGIGQRNKKAGEWEEFDGLSGNQVLLFQALDAFLGIEQYLSPRDQERNLPKRQRELCHALRKHSFRATLSELPDDETVAEIARSFDEILKRLRLFRTAHRRRATMYLSQPAPERLPMTAGKSLLNPSLEQSLAFLDGFLVRRLAQTV